MDQKQQVVPWTERLGKIAKEQAAAEVVSGKFISFRAGQMRYNDSPVANNELHCVVLDSIYENHFYKDSFNPNNITSPVCFAFARGESGHPDMYPHADVSERQNESCEGCANLEWGSSPTGSRGKACKEVRRLAVIPADALKEVDKLIAAPVAYVRVPVMSVKNWSAYINYIATLGQACFSVVTRISLTPDPKSQFQVNFDLLGTVTDDSTLQALYDKVQVIKTQIAFPYPKPNPEEEEKPATKTAAKLAGKKAAKG